MRDMIAAIGLSAAVAAGLPAHAAELKGAPVTVASDVYQAPAYAFETQKGDVGVAYSTAHFPNDGSEVYLQFLGKEGLKGDRVLAAESRLDGSAAFTSAFVAGALGFEDGRSEVYFRGARTRSGVERIGFYGQAMTRSRAAGKVDRFAEIDVGTEYIDGLALKLATRNVVITKKFTGRGAHTLKAHFFDARNAPLGEPVDLSRKGYQLRFAAAQGEGFVGTYSRSNLNGVANVFAQRFDALGNRVGPEKELEVHANGNEAANTQAYGLSDGSILVLRERDLRTDGCTITGETFDADWNQKSPPTPLAACLPYGHYSATPLADGGFAILRTSVANHPRYELAISHFDGDLQQAGKAARIELSRPVVIGPVIERTSGDLFALYAFAHEKGKYWDLVGQFVKP